MSIESDEAKAREDMFQFVEGLSEDQGDVVLNGSALMFNNSIEVMKFLEPEARVVFLKHIGEHFTSKAIQLEEAIKDATERNS